MITVKTCPQNHFTYDTEQAAEAKFRELYNREPGESDIKALHRETVKTGKDGKPEKVVDYGWLYFVEIPKGM
jgi:hypothetical protein